MALAKAKPNPAVAAYLLTLRDKRELSQQAVADAVGVSDRMVSKWEKGTNSPKSSSLPKLLAILGGDYDDVAALMAKPNAAPRDGVEAARRRFEADPHDPELEAIRAKILSLPPEKLRSLGPVADQLSREPD